MTKKNKNWFNSTFEDFELGNFNNKHQKGIAVGKVAREQEGAKKFKNNFRKTK